MTESNTGARDFDDWMREGIEQGWAGPPVCAVHDGLPTTEAEEEDDEPCMHIVRLYVDAEMKTAVEANHAPSIWRNTYTNQPPGSTVNGRTCS